MRTISRGSVRILSMGVFLFCLMFPFISDAVADSQPASLLNTAQEARESGDGEKAKGFYQQIIDNYPTSKEAITACQELVIRRVQLHEIENAESLVETLKTTYFASPDTVDALYSIAQHYQWNGLPEEAMDLHRYNSAAYPDSKKALWSHGAIVHYYIEQKDFDSAQKEYAVMVDRFKEQPTLPQEIHQFAEKYRTTDEPDRAVELHRYNTTHSPVSSMYTMWSQGAIVHHYIRQKDYASAQRETDVMISRFSQQPTFPQELHQIAEEHRYAGQTDRSFELHRHNATHSPVSSKYTMQSQGALVHALIEQKAFYPAEVEYQDLLSRFKDQPTLPQEIYQFAVKYASVGEKEKAMELHRYNATHSPAASLHAMQSQGAIVHHCIETKDFEAAQREVDVMTGRFSEQETFPQELYQFAQKYQGAGATEKALALHRYNSTHSAVSAKHTMWSQGALIHHLIDEKDFVNAQKEYGIMQSRFKDQPTLPQEICQIADKYQQNGQYEQSRNLCRYGLTAYPECPWRNDFQKVLLKTLLAESEYEQAMSVAANLIEANSENSAQVRILIDLGHIYREARQWPWSIQYYQQAIEKTELPDEKLDAYSGIAKARIRLSSDAPTPTDAFEIKALLDIILSQYIDCKAVGLQGIQIGEEYYYLGKEALENALDENAENHFSRAIAIWNQVINSEVDSGSRSECYCRFQ